MGDYDDNDDDVDDIINFKTFSSSSYSIAKKNLAIRNNPFDHHKQNAVSNESNKSDNL